MSNRSQDFVSSLQPAPCPPDIEERDQIDIWNAFEQFKTLAIKKNQAYGSSVFTQGILTPDVPIDAAIRTRLSDKFGRILNLMSGCKNSVPSESLLDTWADASTYCLLEWIYLNRQVPQPAANEDSGLPVPTPPVRTLAEIQADTVARIQAKESAIRAKEAFLKRNAFKGK